MKTLRYIITDALVGIAAMLLLYFVGVGLWLAGVKVYEIYSANGTSVFSGIALSMMFAGAIVGAFVGFLASRGSRGPAMFDPKRVTPEQLDQMEKVMGSMTTLSADGEVDIEEMQRKISELGASLSAVNEHSTDLRP
jgi:hypothetical protein